MGAFGGLILTNAGRALQAKAQAGETQLRYTRIKIGDGQLGGQSIPTLTNLISEKKSLDILKIEVRPNAIAVLGTMLSNGNITEGFYFREIGVFAQDPVAGEILYCYANAGANAEYIPPGGGADIIEKYIDIRTLTGNAQNVSAGIDESLVYVTKKDYDEQITILQQEISANSATADAARIIAERAENAVDDHISDTDNPHNVTPSQIGAETPEDAQAKADAAESSANQYTDQQIAIVNEDITAIEEKLGDDEVRDLTISNRMFVIPTDRATPLYLSKIKGRTLVNLLPLFNSGLWTFSSGVTVESPTRISYTNVNGVAGSYYAEFTATLKPGTWYYMNFKSNGHYSIRRYGDTQNFIVNNMDVGTAFNTGISSVVIIRLYDDEATPNASYYFENITLSEGSQPQEFVANMKSLRGVYVRRYGKNILPPLWEWRLVSGAKVTDSYKMELDAVSSPTVSYCDVDVREGHTYYLSCSTNNSFAFANVQLFDASGNSLGFSAGAPLYVPAGAVKARIRLTNSAPGYYIYEQPMLNLGSRPLPFEPQNDDYLYADVELASNVDGSIADTLEYRDGRYWKAKRFEKVALDGSLGWTLNANATGYKRVHISMFPSNRDLAVPPIGVKYNGTLLEYGSVSAADVIGSTAWSGSTNNGLLLTVSNADSGWGDNYTPTVDEIKAYFNGWRMYVGGDPSLPPYNGTGTKQWAKIYCGQGTNNNGVVTGSGTSSLPTTVNDMGYTPYQLQYQLATLIVEDVTDKIEGSISLFDGDNLVGIGEAVVVRESTNPQQNPTSGTRYINELGWSASIPDNPLKNRVLSYVHIYRNGKEDNAWTYTDAGQAYANGPMALCTPDKYADAMYTATYIAEPYTYSAPVQSVAVQYATNVKTVLDRTVQDVADLTTRVSEIPRIYATISQEAVVHPTILGGWNSMDDFGFIKMSDGLVVFQGGVNGGGVVNAKALSLENAVPVCYLPPEYRPISPVVAIVPCRTGSFTSGTWGLLRVHFHPNGKVAIYEYEGVQSAEYVWFDRIVYYRGFAP